MGQVSERKIGVVGKSSFKITLHVEWAIFWWEICPYTPFFSYGKIEIKLILALWNKGKIATKNGGKW